MGKGESMSTINDFKIVSKKSIGYFDNYIKTNYKEKNKDELEKLDNTIKSRLGFYFMMIEEISGISDFSEIAQHITDTEFNKIISGEIHDDYGIDSIIINSDKKKIKLFNFKFRGKLKNGKQSTNETIKSSKFFNAIKNENTSGMSGKIEKFAKEIIDCNNSSDVWETVFYIISNDDNNNNEKIENDKHIKQFRDIYDLKIESFGLHEISNLISPAPNPINAQIILDREAVMTFAESELSSSKSYIFRIPLSEVIRITCNNSKLRDKYNIEDIDSLSEVKIENSVLFNNVRGFILKSKFNKNINKSIIEDPKKFFLYNNGLTIVAQNIIVEEVNGGKKLKMHLEDFQIINGGQTLRTIHNVNESNVKNISNCLNESQVLIRALKTNKNINLNNKIAESTNSQNSISNMDLKSLRKEQIDLEVFLKENNILYSRKSGDIGINDKEYQYQITMEKLGQILISLKGLPEKSTNDKKNIFDKYYQSIFIDDTDLLDKSLSGIKQFYEIKQCYLNSKFKDSCSDQRIFYVIYIIQKTSKDIVDSISLLEKAISSYKSPSGKKVSDARKIIQTAFKNFLDDKLGI